MTENKNKNSNEKLVFPYTFSQLLLFFLWSGVFILTAHLIGDELGNPTITKVLLVVIYIIMIVTLCVIKDKNIEKSKKQ